MLYQTFTGHQCQNFTLKYSFLTWRRASEKFDCYPKMGNTHFVLKPLWSVRQGGMSFLIFYKT